MSKQILPQLMAVIQARKARPAEKSYTATLLHGGVDKIGGKILEEAAEVVEAAAETGPQGRHHLIMETADLLYHLLVMLGHREIDLAEVEDELARRFGVSGLDEKAARSTPEDHRAEG
ncbi:MAG: phosphoribosyl-ATP diphosphatase [Candidatus Latescibacteria bacterium]|nr:phosphoribosyl-ATP diphosphatase [Candidatus Latescibacterota bacterium]